MCLCLFSLGLSAKVQGLVYNGRSMNDRALGAGGGELSPQTVTRHPQHTHPARLSAPNLGPRPRPPPQLRPGSGRGCKRVPGWGSGPPSESSGGPIQTAAAGRSPICQLRRTVTFKTPKWRNSFYSFPLRQIMMIIIPFSVVKIRNWR